MVIHRPYTFLQQAIANLSNFEATQRCDAPIAQRWTVVSMAFAPSMKYSFVPADAARARSNQRIGQHDPHACSGDVATARDNGT
jgi:hypothetical protein